MKSIKEKTNEVFDDPFKQECFESGANYVLDAIADVINQPMNDYLVLEELKKVILQLKK